MNSSSFIQTHTHTYQYRKEVKMNTLIILKGKIWMM